MGLLFIMASIAFAMASLADFESSNQPEMRERWPIYKGKGGRFSPGRYIGINLAAYGLLLLLCFLLDWWIAASVMLFCLAALRIYFAIQNKKWRDRVTK